MMLPIIHKTWQNGKMWYSGKMDLIRTKHDKQGGQGLVGLWGQKARMRMNVTENWSTCIPKDTQEHTGRWELREMVGPSWCSDPPTAGLAWEGECCVADSGCQGQSSPAISVLEGQALLQYLGYVCIQAHTSHEASHWHSYFLAGPCFLHSIPRVTLQAYPLSHDGHFPETVRKLAVEILAQHWNTRIRNKW